MKPNWRPKPSPYRCSSLALCITGALLYFFRKKAPLPPTEQEIKESALNSIEQLKDLSQKEYFARMSTIMRHFLTDQTQTTEECLRSVKIKPENQTLLHTFFKKADQVNYAHHQPTEEERDAATDIAKTLINKL